MKPEIREVGSDGLTLMVEEFGEGPPFLFAHSLGACRHHVRRALEPLAERFRVIVFDQRGHCESSPVTDTGLYSPARMAGDLEAILDTLDIPEAIIGGESMGAATSLVFAIKHPKRVQHLLLVAPTAADEANPGRDMILALADFAEQYGLEAAADAVALGAMGRGIPRSAAQMITSHWTHHRRESFVAGNRAIPNWVLFDSLAPVAALRIPVGVLAWAGDPSRPISLARRVAAAARRGRLETLDSLAQLAADPQLYARSLLKLLQA
jgi:3-oxoadipate enol-lactonase